MSISKRKLISEIIEEEEGEDKNENENGYKNSTIFYYHIDKDKEEGVYVE